MTKEAMKLALEALEWINRVNAMDFEYQQKARESLSAIYEALAEQPAQQTCNCRWEGEVQVQQCTLHEAHVDAIHEWAERAKSAEHQFKNFHRLLCERFGYTHDERDWRRDQLSLIEWIAKRAEQPAQQEPVLCINPKVIDPATGKVRNGTGALTYSDEPCAGWSLPLYTSPQARKPLTDEQLVDVAFKSGLNGLNTHGYAFARAIEAAHSIKENT